MSAHTDAREAVDAALSGRVYPGAASSATDSVLEAVASVVDTLDPIEVALRGVAPVLELLRGKL